MAPGNLYSLIGGLLLVMLAGCSTIPKYEGPYEEPMYSSERILKDDVASPLEVYDPWEGFNRRMYNFNASFDDHVFLPTVHIYQTVTPDIVEKGVTNFFNNFDDTRTLFNALLQLKFKASFDTFSRVTFNSIIGIFGVIDVATYFKIPRHNEDFGQTLGHYGVGTGPYLVIPIVGPANLRDAGGQIADVFPAAALDPFNLRGHHYHTWAFNIFRAIDLRANTAFRYYQTGSPFEYELVRMLYNTKREMDIAK